MISEEELKKMEQERQGKLKELLQRLNLAENKVNTNQDNTFENAKKEKNKFKKYGKEIDDMMKEYDEYVEKDPEVFNTVKQLWLTLLESEDGGRLRPLENQRKAL